MNTATIKGNWEIAKATLKQKYAQLTDDDLIYIEGREDELLGRTQKQTGRPRAEIQTFLCDGCECDLGVAEPAGVEWNGYTDDPNSALNCTRPSTRQSGPDSLRPAPSSASFRR